MIRNQDLQFTNASQLNDPFDCHPKLFDFSNVPDSRAKGVIHKEWQKKIAENDSLNIRNETWLCSLSKVYDSILMWSHYCYNHKGLCIGLDIDKVLDTAPHVFGEIYFKPFVLDVHYNDIIERPSAYGPSADCRMYQWTTKAREWQYEQEVRLIIPNPRWEYAALTPEQAKNPKEVWDPREIHHYMPFKGECFESIYFGVNIDPAEKETIIKDARNKLNPQINLYQMRVDDNAFKLKPERCPEK